MKPIGAFSAFGAPSWMSFGSLGAHESAERLDAALAMSRARWFLWIVQIMPADPTADAAIATREALQRFAAHGLLPYIVGVTYGEEWFELFEQNAFAPFGYPATYPNGRALVRDWMSAQHARVRSVIGPHVKIIWVTTAVDADHPVPTGVDWVALDPYPEDGESFDRVRARLLASEAATALPLIVVPRWFQCVGPRRPATEFFGLAPSQAHIDGYAAIVARPRWIAMWGWLWESRPHADVLGLADLPETRGAIARSAGL